MTSTSAQAHGLSAMIGRLRRRHDARRAALQLMSMDTHLLSDIGVTRADVLEMLRHPGR